ncbi:BTAD domain-containing putative transcriptional regulator [Kitasatospora sp. NPDC088346]|uniref:AfsR/SARP family transcriptional regulator n=1 Tax=Kitasatospora sp. NPDC088346 TaxID=3364073 RepID=UPI0037FB548B
MRIQHGGHEIAAGAGQRQAVLAVLALSAGRVVTADELVRRVWGESAPPSVAAMVRNHVSRLRATIGAEAGDAARILVSRAGGYVLELADRGLDTAEFDVLADAAARRQDRGEAAAAAGLYREALGLWTGTALSGVPGPYAERQRERLTERRLAVLESCLELELGLGGHARLVEELTALCAEHPLRENPRGLLMAALYRSGRQAEALEVFTATRRVLTEELGVEPGSGLRRLQQRILAADPGLAPPSPATGPAHGVAPSAATAKRPAQLPADVGDFTGRTAEVEAIANGLTREGPTAALVTVSGAAGVGKTTLAVRAARTVRAAFADGQLYADLSGVRGEPADPAEVLGGFLRALGVPAPAIPAHPGERAELYRTVLAGRRVLVVLDEARDEEQIRPLLPGGSSCAVLVTGRARLPGLRPSLAVELGLLAHAEVVEFLSAVVGHPRIAAERAAADDIAAACGGLPLALRIAATKIAARPSWSLAAIAARLTNEDRRLGELRVGDLAIESELRLGYRRLTDELAAAFRRLAGPGLLPSDWSTEEAAAVLGLPEEAASGMAERLVNAGLLDSPGPGRYRFHELVRLFARAEAAAT